jgi:hypothetical protein
MSGHARAEVAFRLSSPVGETGAVAVLTESVEEGCDIRVVRRRVKVLQLGCYSQKEDGLRYLEAPMEVLAQINLTIRTEQLEQRANLLTPVGKDRIGFKASFTPRIPGLYLIQPKWEAEKSGKPISYEGSLLMLVVPGGKEGAKFFGYSQEGDRVKPGELRIQRVLETKRFFNLATP